MNRISYWFSTFQVAKLLSVDGQRHADDHADEEHAKLNHPRDLLWALDVVAPAISEWLLKRKKLRFRGPVSRPLTQAWLFTTLVTAQSFFESEDLQLAASVEITTI